MDRVLLVYEDISEVAHVEATLRKVGFDIESIPNDYNLSEKLLSLNPDVIVAHGRGVRFNTMNVGKRLKESYRYTGKVVLIFPQGSNPTQAELIKVRLDVMIMAPVSTIKLAKVLLKLTGRNQENVIDKLTRIAQTDLTFRSQENSLMAGTGKSIDSELIYLSNENEANEIKYVSENSPELANILVSPSGAQAQQEVEAKNVAGEPSHQEKIGDKPGAPEGADEFADLFSPHSEGDANKQRIMQSLQKAKESLTLRVAAYQKALEVAEEQAILEGLPQPAPKGPLSKQEARKKQKELLKDLDADELKRQDANRREFAVALATIKKPA